MNKETDQMTIATDISIYPNANCRFAYTFNNVQPVRCSFISDQPLFFCDYEGVQEETDHVGLYSDDLVFQALEKDIMDLQSKTLAYEKLSREFVEPVERKTQILSADLDFVTAPRGKAATDLTALIEVLKTSRWSAQMLDFATANGIELRASAQVADCVYDREGAVLLVRADLDLDQQVLLTARELRRMYQHKIGSGLHPLMLHPDHAVLINRAQTADLTIASIRCAWELQLAGLKDAWIRVENSALADLGRAYAREACHDFRSINNGLAAYAAFESWFLSERCRKSDRHLIQQMLADYNGYVFADNIDASRLIAFELIAALGKMPYGENYLVKSIHQIMNDTIFTDVRDRSNANFLWFIKFERSFQEASDEKNAEEKASGKAVKQVKLKMPEVAKPSAEIIALPARIAVSPNKKTASGSGADIVLFAPLSNS